MKARPNPPKLFQENPMTQEQAMNRDDVVEGDSK